MFTINLKENFPAADDAVKILEIDLERLKLINQKVVKIIHGYGSHGEGGLIFTYLKQFYKSAQRRKLIKRVFFGSEWTISNKEVFDFVILYPECAGDEDLHGKNGGITIIEIF